MGVGKIEEVSSSELCNESSELVKALLKGDNMALDSLLEREWYE